MDEIIRISAWCGPRNLSTALMYAFDNRQDCIAFDEPLYAYYLLNSPARAYHPGAEDIISNMEGDPKNLIDFMLGDFPMPIVFFKQMTHHLLDIDRAFMEKMKNVILTRDPFDMIPSFAKVVPNLTIEDIGYKDQLALKEYLNSKGQDVLVVDSKKLQENPSEVLARLCDFCGITFDEKMLKWEVGPKDSDGIWAPYWYESVHKSTHFLPYKPKAEPFPEALYPLLEECNIYYDTLIAIK